MKSFKKPVFLIFSIVLLFFLTGCSRINDDDIKNSAEVFSEDELPQSLMEKTGEADSIIFGQYNGHQDHQNFIADFLIYQHKNNNINQIVLGTRHAYSWIFNAYVKGDIDSDLFVEEIISERKPFLDRIKEYNNNLANDEMITVKTGDINSQEDQFISSLQYMRQQLPKRDTVNRLLNRIISAADRTEILNEFKYLLSNNRSNFNNNWGSDWNKILLEMIEVELESIKIRNMWDQDYTEAHILREDLIKDLAEKRIKANGSTIFNYTFYQAQKNHYLGTRKEWLAEHLVNNTNFIENSYSFLLFPMSGKIYNGEEGEMDIDIRDLEEKSLFRRVTNVLGSDDFIYLDFNTESFKKNKDNLDLYYQQIEAVPSEIFDGVILFP